MYLNGISPGLQGLLHMLLLMLALNKAKRDLSQTTSLHRAKWLESQQSIVTQSVCLCCSLMAKFCTKVLMGTGCVHSVGSVSSESQQRTQDICIVEILPSSMWLPAFPVSLASLHWYSAGNVKV